MDPDANWEEQLRLRQRLAQVTGNAELRYDIERLRELEEALNDWIRRGGFPPKGWSRTARSV